jgi:hypothetical protein
MDAFGLAEVGHLPDPIDDSLIGRLRFVVCVAHYLFQCVASGHGCPHKLPETHELEQSKLKIFRDRLATKGRNASQMCVAALAESRFPQFPEFVTLYSNAATAIGGCRDFKTTWPASNDSSVRNFRGSKLWELQYSLAAYPYIRRLNLKKGHGVTISKLSYNTCAVINHSKRRLPRRIKTPPSNNPQIK